MTTLVAAAVLAACGAQHAAPRVTAPLAPATTADGSEPGARGGDGDPVATATTTDTATTATEVATTPPPVVTAAPDSWASFDAALSARLLGSGDYAVGVAIAVDGEVVHQADFGYRVPPPPPPPTQPSPPPSAAVPDSTTTTTTVPGPPVEPIEPGDRFRIASISKVITAIVVLQFVEAGQVGLDEPVGERLAQVVGAEVTDPQVAAITVRQLLSHTAGFPSYQSTFFRGHVDSCPAAGRLGLSRGLIAPPGTRYTYSNLNYCLLGLLVEQIAGRPYEAVVADRLLAPLGIAGMRLAGTYDADPAHVVHPSAPFRNYMEVLGAAGSWVATAADVVRILASLDVENPGFHPLSAGLVELMRTPVVTEARPDPTRGYGLGLMVFADGAYGHTGTVENTHAMVVHRPDGVTWSVLVSGEHPGSTDDLAGIFERSLAEAGVSFG